MGSPTNLSTSVQTRGHPVRNPSASSHSSHIICCPGVLLGSATVSLPRQPSGNIPLKTEIVLPNLLANVLLVYRLTPKFASNSCKGKCQITTPIHDILTVTRHLTTTPSRPKDPSRIQLPPHSLIHFFPLSPNSSAFSFIRTLHPHVFLQQGVELDPPHLWRTRDMLPRINRHHHRLVGFHWEIGIQVLAGPGNLVYRNRVTRHLAGVACGRS